MRRLPRRNRLRLSRISRRRCRLSLFKTRPKSASKPPPPRRSASSSALFGFGRITSVFRPDKILSMAGAYEREAIRPHVLGRFADMLTAVEGHPAMLFYLDNLESMGPNSVAGINRDKSLNENLAREILELHTLGVRTGYS